MARTSLPLQGSGFERPERSHDGKVMMMRSNPRWCPEGLEFPCWNGEAIRLAFLIDAHDRAIISWRAVANAGIGGADVRDMLLEAVERRSGAGRGPERVEVLTENGSAQTATDTRLFARQSGLKSRLAPVESQQSSGMPEAFVKSFKRDYVRVNPLPNAQTVPPSIGDRIEDCNENYPHSGLKWRSPHEFIRAKTKTAWVSGETGQDHRRRGRKRARGSRTPMPVPLRPNHRWSLDFPSDTFGSRREFRILAVNDDCCRENLTLIADTIISGARVARELDALVRIQGKPVCIISDNGTEFTS